MHNKPTSPWFLPRAPKTPPGGGRRGQKSASTPPLAGKRVLVVDDHASSAKLAAVLLRSEGCEVVIARSAEDAFPVLGSFKPQAIVLDLILPMMSGLLFAQRIKADPATRDIILIAVTVLNGEHTERLAREAGCTAYVQKPINPVTFVECLVEHLKEEA